MLGAGQNKEFIPVRTFYQIGSGFYNIAIRIKPGLLFSADWLLQWYVRINGGESDSVGFAVYVSHIKSKQKGFRLSWEEVVGARTGWVRVEVKMEVKRPGKLGFSLFGLLNDFVFDFVEITKLSCNMPQYMLETKVLFCQYQPKP